MSCEPPVRMSESNTTTELGHRIKKREPITGLPLNFASATDVLNYSSKL